MASTSENTLTAARRAALRRIIAETPVSRQEDLVRLLARAGHRATQSSISRDLREMSVAKVGDRYLLATTPEEPASGFTMVAAFVRDIRRAGACLTIIRTATGSAQGVALAIDRAAWPEVAGTLSGDDTVFIATDGAAAQRRLMARLREVFPA
ncbi:MAG: arginine repressor [Steroidobacteraceae bacterium]